MPRSRYQFLVFAILLMTITAGCRKKPAPIVITPDIEKNHLQRNHIFGKVMHLETATYYLQPDSLPLSDTARLKELTANRGNGDRRFVHHYSYDSHLLDFTCIGEDTLYLRKYLYNDRGQLTEWNERDDLLGNTRCVYSYDRNHFVESEKIYRNDTLVMSFAHKTDGVGNIISTTQDNSQYETTTSYRYDENGLVTEITEYEPDGKVFKTAKIEYDNYGDEVNRCVYKTGNQMIEYTYTQYAQDGRVRKVIYEDKLHHVKEFHYFFNYDTHKNWQTEVCAVDGIIVYIKERKFTYYDE